jgi:hypothetical protein
VSDSYAKAARRHLIWVAALVLVGIGLAVVVWLWAPTGRGGALAGITLNLMVFFAERKLNDLNAVFAFSGGCESDGRRKAKIQYQPIARELQTALVALFIAGTILGACGVIYSI